MNRNVRSSSRRSSSNRSGPAVDVEESLLAGEAGGEIAMSQTSSAATLREGGGAGAGAADAIAAGAGGGVQQEEHGSTLHRSLHGSQVLLKRTLVVLLYTVALVVGVVVAVLYVVVVLPPKRLRRRLRGVEKEDELLTNDWWGLHEGDDAAAREKTRPKEINMRRDVELRTCYITTRDGVKLATDVWIPVKALADTETKTLPVVFHQARYYRSATLRWPFNLIVNGGKPISFINDPFFKSFLSHGMILVSCDVRGTGASFGTHPGPWSPEEQQDSLEVLDWIDQQPWSNGRVALWGASYEGTSAFFTSLLRHPTVVCCCPMFFFWDIFDDVSHPGGVPMKFFSESWQGFNDCLDSGWVQSTGWMARIFLEGVTPVTPEDSWGYQANRAILGHRNNWSLLNDRHIRYMDDTSRHTGRAVGSVCASQAVQHLLAKHGHAAGLGLGGSDGGSAGTETASTSPSGASSSTAARPGPSRGSDAPPDLLDSIGHTKGDGEGEDAEARVGAADAASNGDREGGTGVSVQGGLGEAGAGTGSMDCGRSEHLGVPGGGAVGVGGEGGLEESLPSYLHVSGWQDASAHAAIMAFTTVPCRGSELLIGPWSHGGHQHVRLHHITTRSKFDFTTEVSGFFLGRLSSLKGGAPEDCDNQIDADTSININNTNTTNSLAPSSNPAGSEPIVEVAAAAAAAATAPTTPEVPPPGISSPLIAAAASSGVDDGDRHPDEAKNADGDEGADTEPAVEGAGVLADSNQSKALWARARPRVRYFTHQEERWHDAAEFPSTSSHKTDVTLFLGGKQQQHGSLRSSAETETPLARTRTRARGRSSAGLSSEAEEGRTGAAAAGAATAATGDEKAESGGTTHHLGAVVDGDIDADDNVDADGDGVMCGEEDEGGHEDEAPENRQLLSLRRPAGPRSGEAEVELVGVSTSSQEAGSGRGRRRRDRLSARLAKAKARWPQLPTWRTKLTLSQAAGETEETHELSVDILKDHDGEGISRWAAMTQFWSLISYQMDGMRSNHLRFTSAPLKQDMEVTGYPVVSLWVSAKDDLPNLDVFAYLQAVRPRTGLSIYVTEGCFRAEHRKEAERVDPVDVRALPGVPIHSYLRADARAVERERPVEVRFKLMPTSFKFLKGQRVRLSVGGADSRHFHPITLTQTQGHESPQSRPSSTPPPTAVSTPLEPGSELPGAPATGGVTVDAMKKRVLQVHTGGAFSSGVTLPVPHGTGDTAAGGGEDGASRALAGWMPRSAQNTWMRRRSLSEGGVQDKGGLPFAEGYGDAAQRRRSEGRLQDVLGRCGVDGDGGNVRFED